MAFKLKGFNAGKGTGSYKKPPPNKQAILHNTPRPYSVYDERRDAGLDVSDTAKSPEQRRW